MRIPLVLVATGATVLLSAQTITSVQDGAWSDPATWDCNCVPVVPATVVVQHHVTMAGPLFFGPALVVASNGHLEQVSPGNISCNQPCGLSIGGVLSSVNYMGTGCPVTLAGTWMAGGGLYAGLGLQMNGGTLLVNGNFSNGAGSIISGSGQICITDSSNFQGDVTGTIDICDLTPTTTVPPFVDGGANFVGPGITFCQGSVCAMGVSERTTDLSLTAFPIPATSEVTLTGAFEGQVDLRVRDALGAATAARWERRNDRLLIQVEGLARGLYVVEVRCAGRSGAVRFMKE